MRARLTFILTFALVACQGASGGDGRSGTDGSNGSNGKDGTSVVSSTVPEGDPNCPHGGSKFVAGNTVTYACNGVPGQQGGGNGTCTPNEQFCDGNTLWRCTRSGRDAILGQDCAEGGSANNPGTCSTACTSGAPACCVRQKPPVVWNLSSPSLQGDSNTTTGAGVIYLPSACTASGEFKVYYYVQPPATDACSSASFSQYMDLTLTRPLVTAGRVLTLPDTTAKLTFYDAVSKSTCSAWTGTITWDSDAPSWKVRLNLTCTKTGMTDFKLVGTINGDL